MTFRSFALFFVTLLSYGSVVSAQNNFEFDFPSKRDCNKTYIAEVDKENARVFEVVPNVSLSKQFSEQYGCSIGVDGPISIEVPSQIFLGDASIYGSTIDEGSISHLGSVDRILLGGGGAEMVLSGFISDQNAMASSRFIVPAEELVVRDYGWVTSERPTNMSIVQENNMDFLTDFRSGVNFPEIMARSQEDRLIVAAILPDSRVLVSISSVPEPARIVVDGLSNGYETEIELSMPRKQMQTLSVTLDGYQDCKPRDSDFAPVVETYGKNFAVRCVMEPN